MIQEWSSHFKILTIPLFLYGNECICFQFYGQYSGFGLVFLCNLFVVAKIEDKTSQSDESQNESNNALEFVNKNLFVCFYETCVEFGGGAIHR